MEIKKVLFQDYQEILILTKKNNLDILDEEDWKNLWIKNPFFNENKEKWTVGWKAVYKNKIVGVTCHNSKTLAKKANKNKVDYLAFGSFFKSNCLRP